MMKKAFVLGCGRLGTIIAGAIKQGKVPGVELLGVCDMNAENARKLALELECEWACSVSDMMQFGPDYVLEAAGKQALLSSAVSILQGGADLITLSVGAFSDSCFEEEVRNVADRLNRHVYLASGVVGGFDLMQAACMMGNLKSTFIKRKLPSESGKGDPALRSLPDHYQGNAKEAYELYPEHLNVAVSVGLATGGMEHMNVVVEPGDNVNFTTELKGDFGKARIYSELRTMAPELAAWSAVALLKRVTSRISF